MRLRWLTIVSVLGILWCGHAFGTCTTSQLTTELTTDPASVGYGPYVTARRDAEIASILNTVQAGPSYVVSKGIVDLDTAIGTWGDLIFLLPDNSDATKKARWLNAVASLFTPRRTINYSDPLFTSFFAGVLADGLQISDGAGGSQTITEADVTARTTRQGSRAEVVCGSGTVVSVEEVSTALTP